MTPELEAAMRQAQQAMELPWTAKLFAYSFYAAIYLCAVFSILIFWKLWQIERHFRTGQRATTQPAPTAPSRSAALAPSAAALPVSAARPGAEDSKYMPRQ